MNDDDNNFTILYVYFESCNMINYDSFSFLLKLAKLQ